MSVMRFRDRASPNICDSSGQAGSRLQSASSMKIRVNSSRMLSE